MTAANTNVIVESELDRIVRWRSEELERAGYSAEGAAIDLVKGGCPPDIAVKILL
jgi:hypothetical protein